MLLNKYTYIYLFVAIRIFFNRSPSYSSSLIAIHILKNIIKVPFLTLVEIL